MKVDGIQIQGSSTDPKHWVGLTSLLLASAAYPQSNYGVQAAPHGQRGYATRSPKGLDAAGHLVVSIQWNPH
jgi:hypothetical protein